MGHTLTYENSPTSTYSGGPSLSPRTPPGMNELNPLGLKIDGQVHPAMRDHAINASLIIGPEAEYPDMIFGEDEQVIPHITRVKDMAANIDHAGGIMRALSMRGRRSPISIPQPLNVHKNLPMRPQPTPSPVAYLTVPHNPYAPLFSPEPVVSTPRIYPDEDGFFRSKPSLTPSSAYPLSRLQNSATMSAMPDTPVAPSVAFRGMQNSITMPDTPGNPLTSLRRMMSSSTPGGLRKMASSGSTLKIQSAASSNSDVSAVNGSSVYCDDIRAVAQAPPLTSPLNQRVMQLSATTPETPMTPAHEVRRMKSSASTNFGPCSAALEAGFGTVAEIQIAPGQSVPNEEFPLPATPRYLASGPIPGQNIRRLPPPVDLLYSHMLTETKYIMTPYRPVDTKAVAANLAPLWSVIRTNRKCPSPGRSCVTPLPPSINLNTRVSSKSKTSKRWTVRKTELRNSVNGKQSSRNAQDL
jgi:hypothetical protein